MLRRDTNLSKDDLKYCLPLWFHGDAVEYVDGRSLMVYSMGWLLATGSTLDTTLLLAAIIDIFSRLSTAVIWYGL